MFLAVVEVDQNFGGLSSTAGHQGAAGGAGSFGWPWSALLLATAGVVFLGLATVRIGGDDG